jgi:hypothetical protein
MQIVCRLVWRDVLTPDGPIVGRFRLPAAIRAPDDAAVTGDLAARSRPVGNLTRVAKATGECHKALSYQ